MTVNSHDVARAAGVSHMTVSRVFKDPDKVSAKTIERVRSAAVELGYVPNSMASSFKSSRSTLVAMVVPSIKNSLFAATIQGVSKQLRSRGYHLIVSDSGYDLAEEESTITALLTQRPCGLIIHSTIHTPMCTQLLQRAGVPVIEVGDLAEHPIDSAVSFSNKEASRAMTRHLLERGRKRIGFVMLDLRDNCRVEARMAGYQQALSDAGRAYDENLVRAVAPGFQAGGQALVSLMGQSPVPDAVFFSGDVHAIGALMECQRRGWSVPDQVAIAGFDDHEIADQIVPPLTTLAIPRDEIGRCAAELILGRIDGNVASHESQDLGFSLSVRGST